MLLSAYSGLIRQLPYLEQAFETKKETWITGISAKRRYSNADFISFCEKKFIRNTLKLSRADLFNVARTDFKSAIFSIIFWGYPRNMRGNSFDTLLVADNLEKLRECISPSREIGLDEFKTMLSQLKGVGMSTLSKFLYFFNIELNGHKCLILDKRIVSVLSEGYFEELKELKMNVITKFDKNNYYYKYLKVMERIAHKNGYAVDQLELFLFSFGNNLKPADV